MTDVTDAQAEPQAAPTEPTPSFSDFPIHPDIVAALAGHGITSPSPSRR